MSMEHDELMFRKKDILDKQKCFQPCVNITHTYTTLIYLDKTHIRFYTGGPSCSHLFQDITLINKLYIDLYMYFDNLTITGFHS